MGENGIVELHNKIILKCVKTCKRDFQKYLGSWETTQDVFEIAIHIIKRTLDYAHTDVLEANRGCITLMNAEESLSVVHMAQVKNVCEVLIVES